MFVPPLSPRRSNAYRGRVPLISQTYVLCSMRKGPHAPYSFLLHVTCVHCRDPPVTTTLREDEEDLVPFFPKKHEEMRRRHHHPCYTHPPSFFFLFHFLRKKSSSSFPPPFHHDLSYRYGSKIVRLFAPSIYSMLLAHVITHLSLEKARDEETPVS